MGYSKIRKVTDNITIPAYAGKFEFKHAKIITNAEATNALEN